MKSLVRGVSEIIIAEFGNEYFLERLSDPFWFQSLGCVLGFDWHSSGLTTTVRGALKEAFCNLKDSGMYVCEAVLFSEPLRKLKKFLRI